MGGFFYFLIEMIQMFSRSIAKCFSTLSWGIEKNNQYWEKKRQEHEYIVNQVYEAYKKIQSNNLDGRRDLEILRRRYGDDRVSEVLKHVQSWF